MPKTVLKKLSGHPGELWHPESGLVMLSKEKKHVIGRLVEDEFVSLDDECLSLVEKWNFKIDESLLESNDSSDEQPTEDNEQDDDQSEDQDQDQEQEENQSEEHESSDEQSNEEQSEGETKKNDLSDEVNDENKDEKQIQEKNYKECNSNDSQHQDWSLELKNFSQYVFLLEKECEDLNKELDTMNSKYNVLEDKFVKIKSMFN